jgi:hypothetical protein
MANHVSRAGRSMPCCTIRAEGPTVRTNERPNHRSQDTYQLFFFAPLSIVTCAMRDVVHTGYAIFPPHAGVKGTEHDL